MTGKEIRETFLKYFEENGHTVVNSSSLIPKDDPTLLFTNAGMVQFKNVFLGNEKVDYKRAASSQKCVRAGGKHNDLDNVGYTTRHHTFFEMLGNFSFADYFKKEAIEFGWQLMTEVYNLPENKLWITVFREDQEAFDLWKNNIGLPENRILKMGEEDNFWAMGDTGPCGPCSEILIDQGEEFSCGKPECAPGCDCDRYLELWNLVFMQFNRDEKGKMSKLPNPNIDTGMGLERLAAVLQGVKSNYESDLIYGIIGEISALTGKEYGKNSDDDISMRVIADHARAVNFLISDGVFPSNEGRGYVLRRILRRAVRHAKMLGMDDPFLFKILPSVNEIFEDTYPELAERSEFVKQVVEKEEERFLGTIDRGLELLESEIDKVSNGVLSGEVVFRLYDTYGFPFDLTEDITRNRGIEIDSSGFEKEMEKQRNQSRKSWKGSGEEGISEIYTDIVSGGLRTNFIGYEKLSGVGIVTTIIKDNLLVDNAHEGDVVEVITDVTPFYGESGGQVGDIGTIQSDRFKGKVVDTKKPFPDIIVHHVKVEKGTLWMGDKVKMKVNKKHRFGCMSHHTATHILHAVLKEELGSHVNQAGSLVAPDRLRFDVSHHSAIKKVELEKIEDIVNDRVRMDDEVIKMADVPYEQAIEEGATALFGEKYGDKVRVVKIGNYSKELCGGTHLGGTGEAGLIKIVSESASAAGVRRIEALSGESAWNYLKGKEKLLTDSSALLKVNQSDLVTRVQKLIEENENLKKELSGYKGKDLLNQATQLADRAEDLNGVKLLSIEVPNAKASELRSIWDTVRQKLKSGVVVLGAKEDTKAFILVGVTKDLTDKYHAGNIIKELAEIIGGRGGGKALMAQAGGNNPKHLSKAILKSREIVARMGEEN